MPRPRRRRRLADPHLQRRLSLSLIAAGGVLAAAGAGVRARSTTGTAGNSGSYLLDGLGLIVVVAGAIIEARSADLFFHATPRQAKRRAIGLLSVGIVAALAGCVLASTVFDADAPLLLAALAGFVMMSGAGAGFAGFLSLAWFFGGGYAAERIEKLGEEEW